MVVANPNGRERLRKGDLIGVRVSARSREAPDIGDAEHVVCLEQIEKRFHAPVGVADGPELRAHADCDRLSLSWQRAGVLLDPGPCWYRETKSCSPITLTFTPNPSSV